MATRWAPEDEFAELVVYPEFDVITLEQYDEELRAERDGKKIARRIAQLTGPMTYSCADPDDPEYQVCGIQEIALETKAWLHA